MKNTVSGTAHETVPRRFRHLTRYHSTATAAASRTVGAKSSIQLRALLHPAQPRVQKLAGKHRGRTGVSCLREKSLLHDLTRGKIFGQSAPRDKGNLGTLEKDYTHKKKRTYIPDKFTQRCLNFCFFFFTTYFRPPTTADMSVPLKRQLNVYSVIGTAIFIWILRSASHAFPDHTYLRSGSVR